MLVPVGTSVEHLFDCPPGVKLLVSNLFFLSTYRDSSLKPFLCVGGRVYTFSMNTNKQTIALRDLAVGDKFDIGFGKGYICTYKRTEANMTTVEYRFEDEVRSSGRFTKVNLTSVDLHV